MKNFSLNKRQCFTALLVETSVDHAQCFRKTGALKMLEKTYNRMRPWPRCAKDHATSSRNSGTPSAVQ